MEGPSPHWRDQQPREETQPGCESSVGMNQRIMQQQLCVSTKSIQGLAQKHRQDGPTQGWGQWEGKHKQLTPFPNAQARADPKPWRKCRLEPSEHASEASSTPTQGRGLVLSMSPGTPSPPSFSLVHVAFNPDQTLASSKCHDFAFTGKGTEQSPGHG